MSTRPPNPQSDFIRGKILRVPQPISATRVAFWKRVRILSVVLVIAGFSASIGWLMYSDRRFTRQTEGILTAEEISQLRVQSLDYEAAFAKARLSKNSLEEADIKLLEQALQTQEDYVSARGALGADNYRLEVLRHNLHLIRGENLRMRANQAEAKALAIAKTQPEEAMKLLRVALESENEISKKWLFSGLVDSGKIARLDTRLRSLEAEPLWRKGRMLEKEGEDLEAAGKFSAAADKYNQAIECETEFLGRYRDVRDTEFKRVDLLEGKRETALSGTTMIEVEQQIKTAEKMEKLNQWQSASRVWKDTIDAFNLLLGEYPKSRHADRTREAKLVVRMNFARAHDQVMTVYQGVEQLHQQLQGRHALAAAQLATTHLAAARKLADENTGAFLSEDPTRQELEFIANREATLRALLATIDLSLVPLPAPFARTKIYRQEVSQGLYASLMDANPSALQREAHPVESVSYADTQIFCQKLGWALGSKVRLPTLEEFRAAAGDVSKLPAGNQAWTFENTDGVNTRPVATSQANVLGIYDILGNVEEWTNTETAGGLGQVVGGSVTSPAAPGLVVRSVNKREKRRTLGFRIIID
ncbi:MAG: SUMF1/EgtB/PvdO family nonheme iron enzyme [Verrucomicrobia bacterium]|nr:SUMF1/EgtB/PvdO family nonheme iron enzyme [Verrucomicrobiota bacterium]